MAILRQRLGEILVAGGIVNEAQLQESLDKQKRLGKKLGEILVQEGLATEEQIVKTVQTQMGISLIPLDEIQVKPNVLKLLSEEVARKYNVIPVDLINGQLLLSMENPTDYFAIDDIRRLVKIPIRIAISMPKDIESAINKYYGKSVAEKAANEFVANTEVLKPNAVGTELLGEDQSQAPVVKFINTIIENALLYHASDIHIEPEENRMRVRFRVDGVLREILDTSLAMHTSLISRIKIMAELNIAERRVPQDGRISHIYNGRLIDLRVSTAPTVHGEKVVMRVLDKSNFFISIDSLGLLPEEEKIFHSIITKPYGMILVTGPTGSGKTTTLYTILSLLNDVKKNIVTLEDPVEYYMKGINQIQVNNKANITFATGLRSILRQDPDIMMVGEIRDLETADISIRAALTGHLVLSTLHTNDAATTISRLVDIGIEPFMLSATLNGIIAQRLVRKICVNCKETYDSSSHDRRMMKKQVLKLYRGKGCEQCGFTGYRGRRAIFEILEMNNELRDLIDASAGIGDYRRLLLESGTLLLRDHCEILVSEGITSLEEMVRVTYADSVNESRDWT